MRPMLALVIALVMPAGARSVEPACAVPPALLEVASALPATAAAVARAQPIRIVALGSGTTFGLGASTPAASYPARLEQALRPRVAPPVTAVNQGVRGQTVADMLARLDRDVLASSPTLVLWETGTVDAVRGVGLDEFSAALETGIARIQAAGGDVLLIDPQYARSMPRLVNILPFVEAMRTIAAGQEVILFDRFEVMRYWIDNDVFHLDERAPPRLAGNEIDQVYDCIAQLLAQVILSAIAPTAPTAAK
jgi:lysophospholipase L1-like esterase